MKTDKKIIVIPDFIIMLRELEKMGAGTLSQIHRKSEITYSHLHLIKNVFFDKKWITEEIDGRKKILRLTTKGRSVMTASMIFLEQLDINDVNIKQYRRNTKIKKEEDTDPDLIKMKNNFIKLTEEEQQNDINNKNI